MGFESLSRNARPQAVSGGRAALAAQPQTDTEPILSAGASQKPCTRTASERRLDRAIFATLAVSIVALIVGLLIAPREAEAAEWRSTTATWYGPGFYGNGTACGQTYTQRIRGVAIGRDRQGRYYARCGDTFVIRHRARRVTVRVIDRCPGCVGESHRFDLSARTAMDLCACWQPYTMPVRWARVRR